MALGLLAAPAIATAESVYTTDVVPNLKSITVSGPITNGSATLTIAPAEDCSTMLIQSNKATAPKVSGKLEVGSPLGTDGVDGTVVALLDAGVTSHELKTDIAAGEGFYLHAYAV